MPTPSDVARFNKLLKSKEIIPGFSTKWKGSTQMCDVCRFMDKKDKPAEAVVDGKTTMGPWAKMCESHFVQYGIGLGTGRGQALV